MHGIDHGHQTVEREPRPKGTIGREQLKNRCRVRKTRRLDNHSLEIVYSSALSVCKKLPQRAVEVRACCTAHTSVSKQNRIFGACSEQRIIDTDLPELVDDK